MITIKTPEEIEIMAEGGKVLAKIMKKVEGKLRPGIKTKELNELFEELVFKFGAKPSFKGEEGFPASLCTCINEEIVHCPPSERILKEGDILSLDGGILWKGFHSDMAVTVPVGEISFEAKRLIRVTKKALKMASKKVKPGNRVGDISNAIQRYVEYQGFHVIAELTGHGIGRKLHEEPEILNFGKKHTGPEIKEGMVICIEPMVSMGDWKIKKSKAGYGWETRDGSLSAHFEHTVAVTKDGCEILTNLK